jgi:DNA-binding transcriptional ArsR family regulator
MEVLKNMHNEEELERTATFLKAIAHPMRIAILELLSDGDNKSVTQIYQRLGLEQAVASHHLGLLKNKGVLNSKRVGKNIYYTLKTDKLVDLIKVAEACTA